MSTYNLTNKPIRSTAFKGLRKKNKDGKTYRALSDLEYMELLGRKAIELDKKNTTRLPTNYGDYDRQVVQVAKDIVNAIDNGDNTREEASEFLKLCIDTQN